MFPHHKLCTEGGYRAPHLCLSASKPLIQRGWAQLAPTSWFFVSGPLNQQQNPQCLPRRWKWILAARVWLLTSCCAVCFSAISQSERKNLSVSGISHKTMILMYHKLFTTFFQSPWLFQVRNFPFQHEQFSACQAFCVQDRPYLALP